MRKVLISALMLLGLVQVKAQAQDAAAGKALFSTTCTSCHGIGKQVVGPDLKDVDKLRSEDWIIHFVHSSQKMVAAGDTAAVNVFNQFNKTIMPDHPQLSDADIKNIIAYIKEESPKVTSTDDAAKKLPASEPPYPNSNGGFWHRLVFLDFPGHFEPLTLHSYAVWCATAAGLILLVFALCLRVQLEDVKKSRKKEKEEPHTEE